MTFALRDRGQQDSERQIRSTSPFAALRGSIERIVAHSAAHSSRKVPLGHVEADAHLQGGLALGAMHEVFADAGRQSAAATGFIAGLAGRVASRRPVVWIRQDFTEVEAGAVSMNGLCELGLDPRLLVSVHATDVDHALRATADALACDAVGAVVLEVWGEARQLDLVASRKLTLAAQMSGVTALLLERRVTTPADLKRLLTATATPLGTGAQAAAFGAGLVDARKAIAAETAPPTN